MEIIIIISFSKTDQPLTRRQQTKTCVHLGEEPEKLFVCVCVCVCGGGGVDQLWPTLVNNYFQPASTRGDKSAEHKNGKESRAEFGAMDGGALWNLKFGGHDDFL